MYKILSAKGNLSLPPGVEMEYNDWKSGVINSLFEQAKREGTIIDYKNTIYSDNHYNYIDIIFLLSCEEGEYIDYESAKLVFELM